MPVFPGFVPIQSGPKIGQGGLADLDSLVSNNDLYVSLTALEAGERNQCKKRESQ
jgi:hypothetical protein